MAIVKWDPLIDLMMLKERMDRIFDESMRRSRFTDREFAAGSWNPAMDVFETPTEFHIQIEAPGMGKGDISLSVEDGALRIRGSRSFKNNDKEENFLRIERQYGNFERSFKLPKNVDAEKAEATFSQGLLEVVIPKIERSERGQLKIDIK